MQVEVRTDHNVGGGDKLTGQIVDDVTAALSRFSEHLTRVEVHLSDENADKGGVGDKRCVIEARPAGLSPVAVTDHGDTVEQACSGALRKLTSLLDTRFGKLANRKGGDTLRRAEQT
ncbi:MAG TPA: hypothetical protein PK020_01540 [Ilumatobacteraceae bacterium]|nr:hypothetical protein [Ilumatobacteraceae bacterium]HRB02558.1 hypothetical protein [Ilumatobacteraceae bacterium]